MVTAAGASTTSGTSAYAAAGQRGASAGSRAGLESQLNTFKKQLSDCIDCASAKTPEGKAKIEDLQARVSTTQARIKELDNTQAKARSGLDQEAPSGRIADKPTTEVSDVRHVQATSRSSVAGAGPGSLVDTFA